MELCLKTPHFTKLESLTEYVNFFLRSLVVYPNLHFVEANQLDEQCHGLVALDIDAIYSKTESLFNFKLHYDIIDSEPISV